MTTHNAAVGDLLYGARPIAEHLGITERQARYLIDQGTLPSWKEGKTICARRSSLNDWMDRREAAAAVTSAAATDNIA
jgi:excisionase family DNA binding protein